MSGGNRGINMRSEREVIGLIRTLEAQGARVEWANTGRRTGEATPGRFPARVYPPNPDQHFILFHGSVSDSNAATIKRNEIRRAGLRWPGDDGVSAKHLRKAGTPGMTTTRTETTMSDAATTPATSRAAGEHLVVPPGARDFATPSPTTRERFTAVLDSLPETFWTDHAVALIRSMNIAGYNSSSGLQRVQGMLDYFGFRVVESKPNRNGQSYRWTHEVEARTDVADRNTNLRAVLKPDVVQPVETVQPVEVEQPTEGTAPAGFEVFQRPLQSEAGPIAAAFAEAERKRQDKGKHMRVMCADCKQWFTFAGLERHFEDTGHDKPTPVATVATDEVEPIAAEAEVATITVHAEEIEALRGGPVDLEQALQQDDSRDDAAEWRALIAEAEAETARVREEAALRVAEIQQAADLRARDVDAEADARIREYAEQYDDILAGVRGAVATAVHERDEARADLVRLQRAYDETELVIDDTWLIDLDANAETRIGTLVKRSALVGITLELRGRRA